MNSRASAGQRIAVADSWWLVLFRPILDRIDAGLEQGRIDVRLPDGRQRVLGGRQQGPAVRVDLRRWRALARLALNGSVGWYQAWEAGEWDADDPVQLFDLFMRNRLALGEIGWRGLLAIAIAVTIGLFHHQLFGVVAFST